MNQIRAFTLDEQLSNMTLALAKPGEQIILDLTPEKADLLHMAVGVSGEAGELLDCIKKHVIYNKPLDRANAIEELGDIEFYLNRLRNVLGITRDETIVANIAKLSVRYSSGKFSNDQAQQRSDKVA